MLKSSVIEAPAHLVWLSDHVEESYMEVIRKRFQDPLIPSFSSVEEIITYVARVSNPSSQHKQTPKTALKLLRFLVREKHWSPLQHVYACVEMNTTRDVGTQLLRHQEFDPQELSQRYADVNDVFDLEKELIEGFEIRLQDTKNRQNSIECDPCDLVNTGLHIEASESLKYSCMAYKSLLNQGVAKECARRVLPICTPTRMYMTGSIRTWFFYLLSRNSEGVQKEHRELAKYIEENIFANRIPSIIKLLNQYRYVQENSKYLWKEYETRKETL